MALVVVVDAIFKHSAVADRPSADVIRVRVSIIAGKRNPTEVLVIVFVVVAVGHFRAARHEEPMSEILLSILAVEVGDYEGKRLALRSS
eukprot:CAMPEP_0172607106 /NCGR_PEP_ID=MMETSP1068-20121228/27332_1 /TAXON_ID=35684 /ORGANISM="Pseudopedinella elastica, Strain CCMP716" /LENGTH=88 /DNA_ID=CAMNT_0013410037 /DNA_START=30 /DNA_END=296 /DNA_ORIENTATION=-